jgi:hypothetical protein
LIVAEIVDGQELPPESYQLPWSNLLEIKHERVLREAVYVLSNTYWPSLSSSIDYLYKIAKYKPESLEYAQVREKASEKLVEIAELKPGKCCSVQLTILNFIEKWLKKDFASDLELSLSLIQPMFSMEFDISRIDPTKHLHIITRQGIFAPSESLRQVRQEALRILYQGYDQASNLSERLKIVTALKGAIVLPSSTDAIEVSVETWDWLEPDCQKTAQFLLCRVMPQAELPVLDAVAEWLWYAPRFSRYQLDEFEQLKLQLQNNKLYQIYGPKIAKLTPAAK